MALVRTMPKGQIALPAGLRREAGITAGTYIEVECVPEGLLLRPLGEDIIEATRGMLKGYGSLTEELLRERALDREREEAKLRWFDRNI